MATSKWDQIRQQFVDRGLVTIGQGSGRRVFLSPSGRFVFKVPLQEWGLRANQREHQIYRYPKMGPDYLNRKRCARCRLAPSGVLVMELVRTGNAVGARLAEDLPDWALRVESYQVGTNRAGDQVAYDFGGE